MSNERARDDNAHVQCHVATVYVRAAGAHGGPARRVAPQTRHTRCLGRVTRAWRGMQRARTHTHARDSDARGGYERASERASERTQHDWSDGEGLLGARGALRHVAAAVDVLVVLVRLHACAQRDATQRCRVSENLGASRRLLRARAARRGQRRADARGAAAATPCAADDAHVGVRKPRRGAARRGARPRPKAGTLLHRALVARVLAAEARASGAKNTCRARTGEARRDRHLCDAGQRRDGGGAERRAASG
jgi:hypothetical protein